MKYIQKYLTLLLSGMLVLSACKKGFVNLQSTSLIAGNQAYASENSVQALLASLYGNLVGYGFEDLTYWLGDEATYEAEITDEAVRSYTWGSVANDGPIPTGLFPYWHYDYLRQENDFINQIPNATAINPDDRKTYLAEARFLRAYTYFAMVKRYGGVPLVTTVLSPTAPLDSLKIPRNKEQEIYDFIGKEIDAIANDLPTRGVFHASKYAALALKCKAMLYAASIAEYC
jgi:hypothetical protein